MNNLGVVIGRPINGISLNGLEFLLEKEDGDIKHFQSLNKARSFLIENGVTPEDVDEFEFRHHLLNPDTLEEKFILLDEDVA